MIDCTSTRARVDIGVRVHCLFGGLDEDGCADDGRPAAPVAAAAAVAVAGAALVVFPSLARFAAAVDSVSRRFDMSTSAAAVWRSSSAGRVSMGAALFLRLMLLLRRLRPGEVRGRCSCRRELVGVGGTSAHAR